MASSNVETFLELTRTLQAACRSIEIAALLLGSEDRWHVAAGRVVMWPWERTSSCTEVFRHGDVAAVTLTCDAALLPSIIAAVRDATLPLPDWDTGTPVPLRCANASTPGDYLNVRRERTQARDEVGADWPAHLITLTGQYGPDDARLLWAAQDSLVSAPTPYLNWPDLMGNLGFGPRVRDWSSRGPWISVAAIAPARIACVRSTTTEIQVDIEVLPSVAPTVKLAMIQEGAARPQRRLVAVEAAAVDRGGPVVTTVRLTPPGSSGPVHLVLSCEGWACDRALAGVPDGRAAVHALYDPDGRELRVRLNPKPEHAERLEEAVVWLLHLLGYSSVRYGFKWLNNAPDIVAFADGGRTLVCECSWGPVDPDMITKLKHRAADVASSLEAVGVGGQIIAVAITGSEQRSDDEDPTGPREQGVALLTQKDLQAWAERASLGEGPEPFWDFVTGRSTRLRRWERRRGTAAEFLPGLG